MTCPTLPITRNNLDGTETLMEPCSRAFGPPIPAGTVSDGASVPFVLRKFWPAIGGWYDRAALGHDWRYTEQNCTRAEADLELSLNMRADARSQKRSFAFAVWAFFTCVVFYYGVRIGGWVRWKRRDV